MRLGRREHGRSANLRIQEKKKSAHQEGVPTGKDNGTDGRVVPCICKAQRELLHCARPECIALVRPVDTDL